MRTLHGVGVNFLGIPPPGCRNIYDYSLTTVVDGDMLDDEALLPTGTVFPQRFHLHCECAHEAADCLFLDFQLRD